MGFFEKDRNMVAAEKEQEEMETTQEQEEIKEPEKKGRKPFALWEVGGETYRMKLSTAVITELETKYKTNLINIMGTGQGGMPALKIMLEVAHAGMKQYHHGIKYTDVVALFDKYLEEGGSQLNFYTSVYMNIFAVSGFFSNSLADQMSETLEEANESM